MSSTDACDMEVLAISRAGFSAWNFSSLRLQELSRHPLAASAYIAVKESATELGLSMKSLYHFFSAVESAYKDVPYHCYLHAADVVQAMHCLMAKVIHQINFSPLEGLALIVGAVIHDVGHPV